MTPETLTREATELEAKEARLARALRDLEDLRDIAALMAKTSHDPVSMPGFSFLAARANAALEAA